MARRGARQHDGDDAAAEIGAEHQHDAELRRHEAARGERDDEQDRRDAGMEQPGHERGKQEGGDRIAGQVVDDDRQDLAFAQRLGRFADQSQRQDEQADADQDAAELQQVAPLGGHEQRRAGDQADRHQQLEVEAEQLDDQRRADIGAEHGKQARRCRRRCPTRRRSRRCSATAVALCRQMASAAPAPHRQQRIAQDGAQPVAQHVAIGALDAGAHHARGEQQQRDRAGKMQEDDASRSHATLPPRIRLRDNFSRRRSVVCHQKPISRRFIY